MCDENRVREVSDEAFFSLYLFLSHDRNRFLRYFISFP